MKKLSQRKADICPRHSCELVKPRKIAVSLKFQLKHYYVEIYVCVCVDMHMYC